MKKIFLAVIVMLLPLFVTAKVRIEKPQSRHATSFAIVIDDVTYAKTREAVQLYRNSLEADGLSTYVLSDAWQNPAQLRGELQKLYQKQPNLEGIVLIGDIPVAMVRNAQHMCTAFKMNEETFPMNESSVASDRFYDDLNLRFEFIKQDSVNPLHFYYNLAVDCPQQLNPTYYSGRIMYPEELGGDKYVAIDKFLRKAVAEKQRAKQIDHIVTFAGDAYNSDCLLVWMDEKIALNEYFPLAGKNHLSAKHLNFRMEDFMKYHLFDELARDEVDVMLFNEHGSVDKQHINGQIPALSNEIRMKNVKSEMYYVLNTEARKKDGDVEGAKAYLMKEYGLLPEFFADYGKKDTVRKVADAKPVFGPYGISLGNQERTAEQYKQDIIISLNDLKGFSTMPRFVMFNACYNGSFHKAGNIAGYYIFGDGRTVATQGNTVNVLQDRWTYELLGLLSHGVRVGQYNRLVATLEGHIVGDPTYRFKPVNENRLAVDMVVNRQNLSVWEKYLTSEFADFRSIALRMLAESNTPVSSARLLEEIKTSPFATTRMECLKLLSKYRNQDFIEGIKLGLNDSYELTRRNAAAYAWKTGDESLISTAANTLVNDPESWRVCYALGNVFDLAPKAVVEKTVKETVDRSNYLDKEARLVEVMAGVSRGQAMKERTIKGIFNKELPAQTRVMNVRTVRNSTYHEYVNEFLGLIADDSEDLNLRVNMAETLGWFVYSVRRPEIIAGCNRILSEKKNLEPELKAELTQTLMRLQ